MTNPDRPNLVSSETLERLRTAGFSEHEIDDLLARAREMLAHARAATAAPPSPATPLPAAAPFSGQQASMTGANSKFSTILEQARRAIPAVQGEIGIAGEGKAPASRRFRAFAALAIIPAVVAVLGFGVSLELTKLQGENSAGRRRLSPNSAKRARPTKPHIGQKSPSRSRLSPDFANRARPRKLNIGRRFPIKPRLSARSAKGQRPHLPTPASLLPVSPTSGPVHPANLSPAHGRSSARNPLRFVSPH